MPRSRGRPNPGGDERLRRLEREAALGDSDALSKARAGHYRTGRYHEDVLPKDLQGLAQQEFDRLGDPYSMSDRRSLGELMWEVSQATAPTIPPALAFRAGLEAVVEQAGWRLARRRKSPQPGEVLIDAWARGSWPEIEYGARGLVGSQPLPPARDGRQRYGHTLQESWWRLMCLLFERSTDRNFGWRECGDVPLRRNDWDFGWRIPSQDPSRQSLPQPLWAAFVDAAVRATRKRK